MFTFPPGLWYIKIRFLLPEAMEGKNDPPGVSSQHQLRT